MSRPKSPFPRAPRGSAPAAPRPPAPSSGRGNVRGGDHTPDEFDEIAPVYDRTRAPLDPVAGARPHPLFDLALDRVGELAARAFEIAPDFAAARQFLDFLLSE